MITSPQNQTHIILWVRLIWYLPYSSLPSPSSSQRQGLLGLVGWLLGVEGWRWKALVQRPLAKGEGRFYFQGSRLLADGYCLQVPGSWLLAILSLACWYGWVVNATTILVQPPIVGKLVCRSRTRGKIAPFLKLNVQKRQNGNGNNVTLGKRENSHILFIAFGNHTIPVGSCWAICTISQGLSGS